MDLSTSDVPEPPLTPAEPNEPAIEEAQPIPIPAKKKRKKSKKIPRAKGFPKFFKNGYVRYCDEIRPIVCEANANLDPVEVTKLVAQKWYALSSEEKQPYLDEAKLDKERFKKELKEFEKNHPDDPSILTSIKPVKESSKIKSEQTSSQAIRPVSEQKIPVVTKEEETPKAFVGTNCELPVSG